MMTWSVCWTMSWQREVKARIVEITVSRWDVRNRGLDKPPILIVIICNYIIDVSYIMLYNAICIYIYNIYVYILDDISQLKFRHHICTGHMTWIVRLSLGWMRFGTGTGLANQFVAINAVKVDSSPISRLLVILEIVIMAHWLIIVTSCQVVGLLN